MVQYIARPAVLLRLLLILAVSFSLTATAFGQADIPDSGREQLGFHHLDRKFIPQQRTTATLTLPLAEWRQVHHGGTFRADVAMLILGFMAVFSPVIYKFLLRLLLYPLNYTSQYV
ncbi:hypothetical protein [Paenibacillus donghaensis]|uniref:Uncharacterized protein n=1 Tax=Paenibacillus donghaensis TaxID=414771 RepID=A0A2Z2KBL5_9BACL|nr:hypothetical protein [Paenibacillus donghaensis]ASA21065.1 hypothetical protein B9T62_09865 [Paenibacillus donghaensis]